MPVTTSPDQVDAPRVVQAPKFPEFVALMASLMALTALSIDIMLPALPLIRDSFGVVDPNAQQLVITLYMVGFGVGQLFYGDRGFVHREVGVLPQALAGFHCNFEKV